MCVCFGGGGGGRRQPIEKSARVNICLMHFLFGLVSKQGNVLLSVGLDYTV
jgi:hypothetical protein